VTERAQPIAKQPAWFLPGARMAVLGTVVPFSVRLIFVTTRQNGGRWR
jgi:hypothetical protein